jgi:hypothetical protein
MLRDPEVRQRLLADPDVRRDLLSDPAVRDRVFDDPKMRDRLLDDDETRTRVMAQPAVQQRLADDDVVRDRILHDQHLRQHIVQDELERRGVLRPRYLGNVPATAGLTLGIVSVLLGWVPVLFAAAGLFGVAGLVLSAVGRGRATADDERTGGGRATMGIAVSIVGIAMAVVGFLVMTDVINVFDGTITDVTDQLQEWETDLSDNLGS